MVAQQETSVNQGKAQKVLFMVWNGEREIAVPLKVELEGDETVIETISFVHERIHEGDTFSASYAAEGFADNAVIDFVITTGVKQFHLTGFVSAGGDALAYLYEAPTVTGGTGTAQSLLNKNRTKTNVPNSSVLRNPTVTNVGTLLQSILIPGGTGGNAVGATTGARNEWILAPNTKYLVRLQNVAGTAQPMAMDIEGYEI